MGCDLSQQYNRWAMDRLDRACQQSDEAWIAEDRATTKRRESIR
jgi:site-specific DNA-methyltransferase (adenine-specific)